MRLTKDEVQILIDNYKLGIDVVKHNPVVDEDKINRYTKRKRRFERLLSKLEKE